METDDLHLSPDHVEGVGDGLGGPAGDGSAGELGKGDSGLAVVVLDRVREEAVPELLEEDEVESNVGLERVRAERR